MYFIECLAIISLILAMMVIFLRKQKKKSAMAVFPLIFVPAAHDLFWVASKPLSKITDINPTYINIFFNILALIIAGIFMGAAASKYKNRVSRMSYLIICGGFTLILTFVLVIKVLQ